MEGQGSQESSFLREPTPKSPHKIGFAQILAFGIGCNGLILLAPQVGLEPTTLRLTGDFRLQLLSSNSKTTQ